MENVHRQCSENYDVEFYSTNPALPLSQNSQNWKNQVQTSSDMFSNNNNHLSSNSDLNHSSSHHAFSINVSTGESDLFIDDLIELADESMTSSATSSSVMSTPSPVMVPQSKALIIDQHPEKNFVRSAPTPASAPPGMPYHSRLHEALTQPRLPTQPVRCHRCGNELTSRCLMQVCSADDTRCRQCGLDLTAKCILAVCTVQPKVEMGMADFERRPHPSLIPPASTPKRQRVHHYSSPQPSTSKSNLA